MSRSTALVTAEMTYDAKEKLLRRIKRGTEATSGGYIYRKPEIAFDAVPDHDDELLGHGLDFNHSLSIYEHLVFVVDQADACSTVRQKRMAASIGTWCEQNPDAPVEFIWIVRPTEDPTRADGPIADLVSHPRLGMRHGAF